MDNYWDNYIQTKIIQPLEVSLQGNDPGVGNDGSKLDLKGKVWNVSEKNNQGDLLHVYMRPYIEEFLFEPHHRMRGFYSVDETIEDSWKRMGTGFIRWFIRNNNEELSSYFVDKNLHEVVESWISNSLNGASIADNRRYLIMAVSEGYDTDWRELQQLVVPELKNCPSDYDKLRLEYYCTLDAIIKIALDDSSDIEQKRIYWSQIGDYWNVLSAIYSVMTGKIINSGYNHISAIIGRFKGSDKPYARLMYAALRHHPQVLPTYKSEQYLNELQVAQKEIKQIKDLDDICGILFPTAGWSDYDVVTPRMTTAEMMQKVRESEELKRLLKQVEEYARTLQAELDDAIKMQSIREAFTHLDPATARAIFAQIDMVLEGNNEVWDRNRLVLKREVNLRYENHQRIIEGTHEQAQLAADYSKKAATQTHLIQVEGGDVKCEFNAPVGNVIGNVEHMDSKNMKDNE